MTWRRTRRTNSNQAFVDMLYNKLIQFFVLFILAFILINPIAKEADIESKAEIIVTIDWDEGDHDVDLWCKNPKGKTGHDPGTAQESNLLCVDKAQNRS